MKRFLPYILIGVVIMVIVFGPITLRRVEAQVAPPPAPAAPEYLPTCSINPVFFDLTNCVVVASYYILFMPTAAILWFAGQLFNGAVFMALEGKILRSDMVSTGWTITRDVANLFFIFILLYIAIATILRVSGYRMKELLARIIIIALLVNFSLVITKVIIDSSNILALEFYNKMTVHGGSVTTAIFGKDARDISAVFIAGFNPQQLFASEQFGKWVKDTPGSTFVMLVLFLIASIMNLVATFILMAGGILFIIRVAVLWLLMILAPLAFLFMVLPKTQQYANQWWDKLFNQSFFAPAFLFLFYLVAMLINKGFLKDIFNNAPQGLSGIESFFASIFLVFLNFTVLAVLMIACLIVAQKMGAVGASTVQGWGKGAAKWGRGYAGRVTGRMARRATAPIAEAFATGESKGRITRAAAALGRGVRKVPLVGAAITRGAAEVGVASRARLAEIQKGYENYSNKELKNMMSRLTPFNRTAVIQELAKRGDLRIEKDEKGRPTTALNDDRIKESMKIIKRYSGDAKPINQLRPDLVEDKKEREIALRFANWEKMDKDTAEKIFTDNTMRDEVIRNCGSAVARKVLDVGGKAEEQFFGSLANLGDEIEDIAKKLEGVGNRSLAGWVRGGLGAHQILSSYNPKLAPKKEGPVLYDQYGRPTKT